MFHVFVIRQCNARYGQSAKVIQRCNRPLPGSFSLVLISSRTDEHVCTYDAPKCTVIDCAIHYRVHNTQHRVHNTRNRARNTQHQVLDTPAILDS
jgi:hypothetical protein